MELDKRIKEGKRPLTCFDLKEAEKFEGKEGYFSDCPRDFADGEISIEQCATKGILKLDERSDKCPYINKTTCLDYPYFLPVEWVKPEEPEKKYRPYTIKDFEKAFLNDEFDDFIIFRDKHNPDDIYNMRYNGNFRKGQFESICLGAKNFSFESLFENYEVADYDGDWQPFGVIDEQS